MNPKVLFLDFLPGNSVCKVGSHKYAALFQKAGYELFSIAGFLNVYRFWRRNPEDAELIHCWKRQGRDDENGIRSYTPLCLLPHVRAPLLDSLPVANNCLRFCWPDLKTVLRREGVLDVDILFVHNIRLISILKFIRVKKIIVRISDRIEAFNNVPRSIVRLQEQVLRKADVVCVTSVNLLREVHLITKRAFYLPNGVDRSFIPAAGQMFARPVELTGERRPVVIYVGAISDWFDFESYRYAVAALPDIAFLLIGAIAGVHYQNNVREVEALRRYSNVLFIGPRSHTEIRNYLAYAHAGIIPFTVNRLTDEISPIKLFEYAAFGLPVVASDMAETGNYRRNVSRYRTPDEMIDAIKSVLAHRDEWIARQRVFAAGNTWERRFEVLEAKIRADER